MDDTIQPNTWIAIKLPSDAHKVIQITPDTTISLGKYGTFPSNNLIGRPFLLTFEILDRALDADGSILRIVPAAELYQDIKTEAATPDEAANGDGVEYEIVNPEGGVVMRTNQHIVDDAASQKLSSEEIEALKQGSTSSGRDVIAKILESHSALDKKHSFALAKYTLRKTKKYLKRFTVHPVDVPFLTNWILYEKDAPRIMEIREETLGLMCSWANVRRVENASPPSSIDNDTTTSGDDNRWLVVDETGGLIVAAMADRMGILYPRHTNERSDPGESTVNGAKAEETAQISSDPPGDPSNPQDQPPSTTSELDPSCSSDPPAPTSQPTQTPRLPNPAIIAQETAMTATTNSITLIHPNPQPNLSLLPYLNFDPTNPSPSHPLHTHLRTLSWLQLLHPSEDSAYQEPSLLTPESLAALKSSKKGVYYRKRRRWHRIKTVVDSTRSGGFTGLLIASYMTPITILHHLVPLLRGGAQVVVYSPNIEPLTELIDCYSKLRRAAYLQQERPECPSEEFPLNPLLLLGTMIQTTRVRNWQVLPGRTHPRMTGRGGAEGYVFSGTRVLPLEGRVQARGSFRKRKRGVGEEEKGSGKGAEAKKVEEGKEEADEKVEDVAESWDVKMEEAIGAENVVLDDDVKE